MLKLLTLLGLLIVFEGQSQINCVQFNYDENGNRTSVLLLVCPELQRDNNPETMAESLIQDTTFTNSGGNSVAKSGVNKDSLSTNDGDIFPSTIKIFPNPVSTFLTIRCDNSAQFSYQVYNAQSKLIAEGVSDFNTQQIDVSSWSPGEYIIRVLFQKNNHPTIYKILVL